MIPGMKAIKVSCLFVCLSVLLLVVFADKLAPEQADLKDETVVSKNDSFLLTRDRCPEFCIYSIYFNDSISASDTLLSIKQVIEYCALAESNNPYLIRFGTEDTERLNHLFWEHLNKSGHLSQRDIDDSSGIRSRYKDFLREHLCGIGCVFNESAFLTTPEMGYILDFGADPYLYGEVYMHFNWQNMPNTAASNAAMQKY